MRSVRIGLMMIKKLNWCLKVKQPLDPGLKVCRRYRYRRWSNLKLFYRGRKYVPPYTYTWSFL